MGLSTQATDSMMEVSTQKESLSLNLDDVSSTQQLKDAVLAFTLFVIVVITTGGNIIVLVAFYVEKKLRNTFTYFIANLAVTDLLVGLAAMMFYSFDTVMGYWPFGEFMCGVWIFFDYGMTFASVFTLVAISIDRFWAVMWSLTYRRHNTKKKAVIMLGSVWLLVMLIWLPPCILDRMKWSEPEVCWWDPSKNMEFVYLIAAVGHHLPCVIIISCYICVFWVTKRKFKVSPQGSKVKDFKTNFGRSSRSTTSPSTSRLQPPYSVMSVKEGTSMGDDSVSGSGTGSNANPASHTFLSISASKTKADSVDSQRSKEKKIFVTLSYILLTYLVCWVPFHLIFDVSFIRPELVHPRLYTFGFWLAYVNSTLNPIVYAYSNKEFRKAFVKVLTCGLKS